MNGKINQSPTSDESNSTTNDVQTQQNAKRTKRISNASPTFREHHRRELEIIFLHATLEKCEETSAGIMLAGNLCRFMSPYVNDAHKGTKNSIITIPRRDFDFYSPCTMQQAQKSCSDAIFTTFFRCRCEFQVWKPTQQLSRAARIEPADAFN